MKTYHTGIFKLPISGSISLGFEDVVSDVVVDRKHHGGPDKACYIYSFEHYKYWEEKYPELDWNFGMFGENLTVEEFNEHKVNIGETYQLGSSIVQISEPRQPCSTLSMRFNSHQMLKDFIAYGHCGTYLRVLKKGEVSSGDRMILIDQPKELYNLFDVYNLLYVKGDNSLRRKMIASNLLTEVTKKELRKNL